jgi:RNA polymerase sigma-70 factor (ECF subfamily)
MGRPDRAASLKPDDPTHAEEPQYASTEEAFTALESLLLAYARRLTGDSAMSEDVVQEAFMRLHRQFAEVQSPRRWLYRTVHNLALNQLRQIARVQRSEPARHGEPIPDLVGEAADPQPLPDEQIARMEGIGRVRLGLEALDARSRELLRLKFSEDLSYKQIGERTGLTTGHVGYLLHHAIKALAGELSKSGRLR